MVPITSQALALLLSLGSSLGAQLLSKLLHFLEHGLAALKEALIHHQFVATPWQQIELLQFRSA